jgi:hypothetical protein
MDDGIVRVALEGDAREGPLHPMIERIVQEEVGQQRTHSATNRAETSPGGAGSLGPRFASGPSTAGESAIYEVWYAYSLGMSRA